MGFCARSAHSKAETGGKICVTHGSQEADGKGREPGRETPTKAFPVTPKSVSLACSTLNYEFINRLVH